MRVFQQVLPSNYVAQVPGPYYWVQYQAIAEQIADIQLQLEDAGIESDVDFARPEYLWQMIGTLVWPDTRQEPRGIPEIDGDLTYREFLRRMILLLLQGATEEAVEEGLNLLSEAVITVLAKVDFSNRDISLWGFGEQHEFEVNVLCQTVFTDPTTGELITGELGTGFPDDPFRVLRNNLRILRALRPAKSLFEYRHLFLDSFGSLFVAEPFVELDPWYYEDFRKFCCGLKEINSISGVTLPGRQLFSDVTLEFGAVPDGAVLEIFDGPNASPTNGGTDTATLGRYRVVGVRRLASGWDGTVSQDEVTGEFTFTPIPRDYVTSPTGLSGQVITPVNEEGIVRDQILDDGIFTGVLEDTSQDFSDAVEGEIITILSGPNAGDYRLETLLGNDGGAVGVVPAGVGATQVRVAPSILQTRTRMPQEATGQMYRVSLERLGVRKPFTVTGEDASAQFFI
jgi:hypothetical protein